MELFNLLLLRQKSVTKFPGLAFVKQVNNEACGCAVSPACFIEAVRLSAEMNAPQCTAWKVVFGLVLMIAMQVEGIVQKALNGMFSKSWQ